jgi:hypothetical protein
MVVVVVKEYLKPLLGQAHPDFDHLYHPVHLLPNNTRYLSYLS